MVDVDDPPTGYEIATRLPLIDLGGTLHIGADVAPATGKLTAAGTHDGIAVSSGSLQDGVGAEQVRRYLSQVMSAGPYKRYPGLETFSAPPTLRVAEGTSETLTGYTRRAVQLINTALPPDKRIRFGTRAAPALVAINDVPDGEIYVEFAPWSDWTAPGKPAPGSAAGICECASNFHFDQEAGLRAVKERRAAHVWVEKDIILSASVFDPSRMVWEQRVLDSHEEDSETVRSAYSAQGVIAILVHEILHAMGMHHVNPALFPNSMMSDAGSAEDPDGVTGHVLYPIDREALQAAYSAFQPGALPDHPQSGGTEFGGISEDADVSGVLDNTDLWGDLEDPDQSGRPEMEADDSDLAGVSADELGPWSDTSFHIRGDVELGGGSLSFGVALRNGLSQAWVSGPEPAMPLKENPLLQESVTWSGRLLGLTQTGETVGGAADLTVNLSRLDGRLSFTNLEMWSAFEPPGAPGTGARWGDGDLSYNVAIRENAFVETGGDGGTVTGAFFGPGHEAMGGIAERTDLTGSFGGTR